MAQAAPRTCSPGHLQHSAPSTLKGASAARSIEQSTLREKERAWTQVLGNPAALEAWYHHHGLPPRIRNPRTLSGQPHKPCAPWRSCWRSSRRAPAGAPAPAPLPPAAGPRRWCGIPCGAQPHGSGSARARLVVAHTWVLWCLGAWAHVMHAGSCGMGRSHTACSPVSHGLLTWLFICSGRRGSRQGCTRRVSDNGVGSGRA